MIKMNTLLKLVSSTFLILYYWIEGIIMTFVPRRFRLKDISRETALITGGGSGMGRLLALRLSQLGTRVVLWDVNRAGNEETARLVKQNGGEAFPYYCDISDRKQVYQQAARVKDEVGKVTILINNAGVVSGKRFLDIPDEKIVQTFDVNIMSHFWTCKAFLPDMIAANHGHLVSISSMAGLSGVVRLTDYCASKFAAIGFEEALRLELLVEGHSGVHSTVVCPFFTSTGMFNGVRTGCFSLLDPNYVADETIAAIRTNQEILMLPRIFYFLVALKSWFPSKVVDDGMRLFGISTAMLSYTGRQPGKDLDTRNINNNVTVLNGTDNERKVIR